MGIKVVKIGSNYINTIFYKNPQHFENFFFGMAWTMSCIGEMLTSDACDSGHKNAPKVYENLPVKNAYFHGVIVQRNPSLK